MVFSRVADRYIRYGARSMPVGRDSDCLVIDRDMFIDECRIWHPEMSDDQLGVVYDLYRGEWAFPPSITSDQYKSLQERRNIFNIIFRLAGEFIRFTSDGPQVKFRHLFRWRELTQCLGEDILVCAAQASKYRFESRVSGLPLEPDYGAWPTVLHNDDPHLRYIFESIRLCELHSHLKASTDTFGLSWVCLMNNIEGQQTNFEKLARIHDPSRAHEVGQYLYDIVKRAYNVRQDLWMHYGVTDIRDIQPMDEKPDVRIDYQQTKMRCDRHNGDYLDYIPTSCDGPMAVFAGERRFLFRMFYYIMTADDPVFTELFYEYILIKNRLRATMIQINENRGFNNFKRYQDVKNIFLVGHFRSLPLSLPLWEAHKFKVTLYEITLTWWRINRMLSYQL